jgi:hypothetical protein
MNIERLRDLVYRLPYETAQLSLVQIKALVTLMEAAEQLDKLFPKQED